MEDEHALILACAISGTIFSIICAASFVILWSVNWRPWRIYSWISARKWPDFVQGPQLGVDALHFLNKQTLIQAIARSASTARPSYHPDGFFYVNKMSTGPKERTNTITQLWHMNGKCPEDTIPIRRTKKEDVLRASSVKNYGKKKHSSVPKPRCADPDLINESGHQHAIAYVEGDKYYGAKATINVW